MDDQPTTLGVQVEIGPDADEAELSEATLQLRSELLGLDVDAVDMVSAGEPPPGTRAVDLAALGALAVTLGQSHLLRSVIGAVRSWLSRTQNRSIKLELDGDVLELTAVSSKEQRRLTDEWLSRHTSQ